MGVASMVIGIVSLAIGFFPFCGAWAIVPAVIGLGLGIADLVLKNRRKESRATAIAGLVLNPLAIAVILSYFLFAIQSAKDAELQLQQQWPRRIDDRDAGPGAFPGQPSPGPTGWPGRPGPPGQPGVPLQPMRPMLPIDAGLPAEADTDAVRPVPVAP
jgi:hypothetical protein